MLARYRIVRGARPLEEPLPEGERQDTRKHTRHVLRPSSELVHRFLRAPTQQSYVAFRAGYLQLLEQRFRDQRAAFDALYRLARSKDVFIGCNCPTRAQPDVQRCHTVLALRFLSQHYPDLDVRMP